MSLREDFARWREDPMTKMVMGALKLAEKAQKTAWDEASWERGIARADELRGTLQELRVRADCYAALHEMSVEDVASWLGIEDVE
jgi:hypothetical protein